MAMLAIIKVAKKLSFHFQFNCLYITCTIIISCGVSFTSEYFHLFRQSETVIIVEIDHHDAYGKTNYNSFYRTHDGLLQYAECCFTEEVKRVQKYIHCIFTFTCMPTD